MDKTAKLNLMKDRYNTLKEKAVTAKSGGVARKLARQIRNLEKN